MGRRHVCDSRWRGLPLLLLALGPGCRRSPQHASPAADAAVATARADAGAPVPATPAWQLASATAGQHWAQPERAQAIEAGRQVVERHQCTRCHSIDGLPGVDRPHDCVSCHVFLKSLTPGERRYEDIAKRNGRDVLERYRANLRHLMRVPDLSAVGRRLRPTWIEHYLAEPFDLRPLLEDSMLRNRLDAAERSALARYFAAIADVPYDDAAPAATPAASPAATSAATAPATPPPSPERIAAGRARFVAFGCPRCHAVGNLALGTTPGSDETTHDAALLAPNLRFVRERVRPDILIDWILDPTRVLPGTAMPRSDATRADAELIADFLRHVDLEVPPAPPLRASALPPPARDPVSWAEVKERVLGRVCVHCHMNDHEKDQGAGNTGGLGFAGVGLSFRTYERTVAGARGPDGTRHSVLTALPGEALPRIITALVQRRDEARRDFVALGDDHARPPHPGPDHLLGMPLGLPPLPDDEIALLLRWLADGCPGPTEVTGRPGFSDGYLVPDGPIAENQGCALRAPAETRPAWAVAGAP